MVYTAEYASPLGMITLACDGEAITGLWFNGQKHFGSILPRETLRQEHPLFAEARRWLDIYFSGREPGFLPPLRYDSTPFRKLVCDILLTIPYGETMTYGEIAAEAARRQGFFFTGFLPCCGDGEYMILHHPLQVPVLLDDIPFIPEYEPFMAQIRRSL